MQIFTWVFALCALATHHVAAHRISAHSIDTSGSSVMKKENRRTRHGIEESTDIAAKDEAENSTDQAGLIDGASGVITALNHYVAQQKSSSEGSESRIDQQKAESIELLKQPAAEQIVSYIEMQASTIEQLRRENEKLRLRGPGGYFEWNISSEDYSGLGENDYVDSPRFSLGLGSEFWLRYYPTGSILADHSQASFFLRCNMRAAVWASLSVDSVSRNDSPGTGYDKFARTGGFTGQAPCTQCEYQEGAVRESYELYPVASERLASGQRPEKVPQRC